MVCARTRSIESASKRGSASARRSSSKASSACLTSVFSEPPMASLPALNDSSMARAGQALLEGVGIVVARALVEQAAQHLRDARLVGRVLRGAALERERDGDQRHHVGFDVPCLDAARRCQRLHHGGRRGTGFDGGCHGTLTQLRLVSSAGFCRYPVTDRRGMRKRSATEARSSFSTASISPGQRRTSSMRLADGERRAVDAGERGLAVGGIDRLGDEARLGALDGIAVERLGRDRPQRRVDRLFERLERHALRPAPHRR